MTSEPMKANIANELTRIFCTVSGDSTQATERLSLLFDMLQEHIYVTDPQGVIVYTNIATKEITGFDRDEVIGRTSTLWRLEGQGTTDQTFWNTIVTEKKSYHDTVRNVRKNGEMYEAKLQVVPMPEDDGNVHFCLCVESDTSDANELERIQRRVVALTSHNLKTPLTSMRWSAEMLRDGEMGRLSQSQKECVEDILGGITRMVDMVEQWFTVTNLDLGLYTPHNEEILLGTVVEDVLTELQPRIEQEGVSVHFTPEPSPCTLVVDALSIQTIVHTLIFNAVKYNHQGGSVEVHIATLPPQNEYAGRTFPETRVIFSVRDTGLGIPTEQQKEVFYKRFHASNISDLQANGAGLGLYIVRKLVHVHQGDIWFSSSEQGSHFIVALPNSNTVT